MGISNDDISRSILVPALDPIAHYYSRLSARSALYTDLRLLLGDRDEPLSRETYRRLIIDENCLARSSTASRNKLWIELHSRYRLDAVDPLFTMFWKEWRRCTSDPEKSLTAYTLLALNDNLVADLATEWLFPLLRRAPAELRVNDVRALFNCPRGSIRRSPNGPMRPLWLLRRSIVPAFVISASRWAKRRRSRCALRSTRRQSACLFARYV